MSSDPLPKGSALRLLHLDDCPHVVRLTVNPPSQTLAVWVTDLCGIYERELAAADVLALLQKHGLEGNPTQLLATMALHFANNDATSIFELHAQPMRLRWVLGGMQVFGDGLALEPVAAPAARLRDELVLPLLRASEKLARIVPRDTPPMAFHTFVRGEDELPLPNFFSQPRLGELLLRGRRPLGAAVAEAEASRWAEATPVAEAEASVSGVATAAPAAAPAAAPTAEPVVAPAPAPAPVETAEAKRKRKEAEVAEKRARAARKEAAKGQEHRRPHGM